MKSSPTDSSKTTKDDSKERYDGPIICPGHSRPIPDLAYSQVTPDGYFLASACLDGKPMVREGSTGDWIGTLVGHKGAVWSIRLNSPATRAVTASGDFSAKIWDAITGTEIHSFTHKHIVRACEFHPDSSKVFTGGQEKKLRIYDLNKPETEPQVLLGHTNTITHLAVSPDGKMLISGGAEEKLIRIWDLRSLETVKSLETPALFTSFQLSNDGTVLSTAAQQHASFYDLKSFSSLKSFKLSRPLEAIAYHPKAKFFVTGSSDLYARAYDFSTGEEIAVNKGHHGPVKCLAFNPAGDAYASGSVDGTIRIWEWLKEKHGKEKEKEKEKEKPEGAEGDDGSGESTGAT